VHARRDVTDARDADATGARVAPGALVAEGTLIDPGALGSTRTAGDALPDPHALRDVQREFAAALRGRPNAAAAWIADDGIDAAARLRVYANNSTALFERALSLTYAVVERRVGTAFFTQLCTDYRRDYPSRAGDLHEVGRAFPAFLGARLRDTAYAWLGELAALEWAVADAAVAADADVVDTAALGAVPPDALPEARLLVAPSLRMVAATVPVLSVWRANQPDGTGDAVDLDAGPEYVIVHRNAEDVVELRPVPRAEFAFVDALARGAGLGTAIDRAELPVDDLPAALGALFGAGAISGVQVADAAAPADAGAAGESSRRGA
jgi:hypothetical protein